MAAPKISATVIDVDSTTVSLTGDSEKLIRYHSNAKASMTVTSADGAINNDMYIIRNGSRTGYGTTHTFDDVENNVFMFSCEDEYGNIGTAVVQPTMIPYVRLTCNIANNKPDGEGNMRLSCSGNYFNDSFGAKSNSLTVRYSYTGSDGSSGSGNMSVSKYGNAYSAYVNLSGLNYEASYSFVITATDALETVTSSESGVTSLPLFHWGKNDFTFEVPVKFKGGIAMEDSSLCGTWTPRLASDDSGAVDWYEVQSGWYQKLGNVVTIGWLLKAYINSEYHDANQEDEVNILGIPFKPSIKAFGGGVADNINAFGYLIFEGWCVNPDGYPGGYIDARLQPSNKEYSGNLSIASNGCFYPVGGGLMTLAGTICYMTNE